jgi:hypothetical protein
MSVSEAWQHKATTGADVGRATPSTPLVVELTALLLAQPASVALLLAEHADDGTKHCRVCSGGAQSGRYQYPCVLRLAAEEACRRSEEAVQG